MWLPVLLIVLVLAAALVRINTYKKRKSVRQLYFAAIAVSLAIGVSAFVFRVTVDSLFQTEGVGKLVEQLFITVAGGSVLLLVATLAPHHAQRELRAGGSRSVRRLTTRPLFWVIVAGGAQMIAWTLAPSRPNHLTHEPPPDEHSLQVSVFFAVFLAHIAYCLIMAAIYAGGATKEAWLDRIPSVWLSMAGICFGALLVAVPCICGVPLTFGPDLSHNMTTFLTAVTTSNVDTLGVLLIAAGLIGRSAERVALRVSTIRERSIVRALAPLWTALVDLVPASFLPSSADDPAVAPSSGVLRIEIGDALDHLTVPHAAGSAADPHLLGHLIRHHPRCFNEPGAPASTLLGSIDDSDDDLPILLAVAAGFRSRRPCTHPALSSGRVRSGR